MVKNKKTIRICSREWVLKSLKNNKGATFSTYTQSGIGQINIGTFKQNNRYILEMLVHEIIEGILSHDEKRWKEGKAYVNDKILFCFDHEYLDLFCPKLVDALVSCGMVDDKKKII